jgi:hypothetical protein
VALFAIDANCHQPNHVANAIWHNQDSLLRASRREGMVTLLKDFHRWSCKSWSVSVTAVTGAAG